MRFDERVRLYADRLNDTDDQIVDYIMEHREEIADIPIQKMAEALYTVPNTIVRFAKKLGYKGFAELKAALALEQRAEAATLAGGTVIEKTKELLDERLIEEAAGKLHEAKHVFFYGVGDSAYFCEMMAKHLRCIGKRADFFVQRHDMLYNADRCGEKDVVFVISASGETKQVLEAVAAAKQNGAFVISLTHFCPNSLADLADFRLYCWAPKQFLNKYDVTDRTSLYLVLRALSERYWKTYGKCV
ncbi:MurR/RpiR family transcriptional regulator [Geobacillus thermoleovorans]|uniref:MurR/RpiR family transcriptional regulator n=1 Tax=Geobacillus thermoleovorans TaxID=33941 RepID=UPI000845E142|nr:MurR/RpiR family transcriptional regulator [Geobacillus thermoleovorans]AOL34273.1 RpiR family transcriptional regulator [Geobacillus thermoleovorans]